MSGSWRELDFDQFDELAAREDWDGLRSLARRALKAGVEGADRARVLGHLGRAEVCRARPHEAFGPLEEALTLLTAAGDEFGVVDVLDSLSAASMLAQRPEAKKAAEEALARCRALDPVPLRVESRLLGRLAAIATTEHRWQDAIALSQQAIEASGAVHDLSRTAKMYNDLSISYRNLERLEEARRMAMRSVALHEVLQDRLSLARAENNLGLVLMRKHDLEGAGEHFERSLAICEADHLEHGRANVLLSLAELKLELGDVDAAAEYVDQAMELAERLDEPMSRAEAHIWRGTVAARRGDARHTDSEFARAFRLLKGPEHSARLANARAAYAEVLEERGDYDGALAQWKEVAGRGMEGESSVSVGA